MSSKRLKRAGWSPTIASVDSEILKYMAKVTITPAALRVQLSPAEAIWGVHKSLEVPGRQVVGAQALGKGWWKTLGLRIGTGFPGLMIAGTFVKKGDWAYVSWKRGQEVVQINLSGNKYSRIVLGVDDAEALADTINTAITGC